MLVACCLLPVACFLAGCATAPRRREVKPPALLEGKSFRIGKTSYVYLRDFCRAYDLVWDWDTLGKRITLYREGMRINLAFGSNVALVNDKRIDLADTVKIANNELVLPFGLSGEVSSLLFAAFPRREIPPSVGAYKIKRIVIDPGHGGRDPGAVSPEGLREKDVVFNIARDVKKYLERYGVDVILTREDDRFVSLWRRTHIANVRKADLFISIHANSSRWREARGFEVYYLSDKMDDSTRALVQAENAVLELEGGGFPSNNIALAATLWDLIHTENRAEAIRLAEHIGSSVERIGWLKNRGIKGALFYVLKGANMPAILIETGFISNRSESKKLEQESYRRELAEAIGRGIISHRNEYERSESFHR